MRILGFTGTRIGMSGDQIAQIHKLLNELKKENFTIAHHGVCIGADEKFHILAKSLQYYIIGHPGVRYDGTCFTRSLVLCNEMLLPKSFIERDKDIVDTIEILLATPKLEIEEIRSGTWTTIRYARKHCKPIYIVYPSGRVEYIK